ncbi:MAG: LacI family transcriptional regulator [Candidatus Pacebacteria bacterium]|nr:LacI family transcriptional regulator [Candidatus Paceibacterota bacterium]
MVTLRDVARETGTSYATVSRALNGKSRVSPVTQKRVLEVARRLGYRPNHAGRVLQSGKTNTIGLILPCYGDPHHNEVAQTIQEEAWQRQHELMTVSFEMDPNRERTCLANMLQRKCDGVIAYLARLTPVEELIRRFWEQRLPCVVLGLPHDVHDTPVDGIGLDLVAGIEQVIEHLVGLGHRRIAMVVDRIASSGSIRDRVLLFRAGLRRAGMQDCSRNILFQPSTGDTVQDGYKSADRLLREYPDVTAVIAMDDRMAAGMIRRLYELGRKVPDDISIVGTDDMWIARTLVPSLTTIQFSPEKIGKTAIEIFFDRLDRKTWEQPKRIVLPTTLVVRESTGPAKSG